MLRLVLAAALAAAIAFPALAHAEPVSASGADPVDAAGGPSVDLEAVATSYDPDEGRWNVTIRLYGGPSDAEWAMANATLFGPSADDPCRGTELARMRASTRPSSGGNAASVSRSVTGDFTRPAAQGTKAMGPGERELTLSLADPALAGVRVACVSVSLSAQNRAVDAIAPLRFPANEGRVAPPPEQVPLPPLPPPPPGHGAPAPAQPAAASRPQVGFVGVGRRLRVTRDSTVRIALRLSQGEVHGRVVIRSERGAVFGAGPFTSGSSRTVVVKVRLERAARRALKRSRRGVVVRLVATAHPAGGGARSEAHATTRLVR
jgi:hypothetical protein